MATDLTRIDNKARACPDLVFTSLYHHITDIDNLRACFRALSGRKAVGVDGQTKAEYAVNLEANLQDLSARLARMGYRPQPKRRTYVEKPGSTKKRPLGISSFEDKIVEAALKRVLEPLWEPLFLDCSYGYRPERDPHQCVDLLGRFIQQWPIHHIVEADIRGFLDASTYCTPFHAAFSRRKVHVANDRMINALHLNLPASSWPSLMSLHAENATARGFRRDPIDRFAVHCGHVTLP